MKIKVSVPATSANIGSGFDALGLAVTLYNTVTFVSLLTDCRVQLIFCKDYASECNESLLSDCRAPLIFCKDTLFF